MSPVPLNSRRCPSRIQGRPALLKSLHALLLRAHRFGRHRARTADDIRWAAALIDHLTSTIETATQEPIR